MGSQGSTLSEKISPGILLTIVILAIIFFICGLLHLIVRYFLKPFNGESEESGSATAFQGQLRQLFHLHDAGVDQSFIDSLPVFLYQTIIGLKDPFDCAVCLSEFEADDKLRLLPECSHAFHIDCIDTWLLSHSSCPLCRRSLLPEIPSPVHSPLVFLLESASESSRDLSSFRRDLELEEDEEEEEEKVKEELEENLVPIKLGKFRNVENVGGEEDSCLSERRCFSMGTVEYVMNESSELHVAIKPPKKKPQSSANPESLSISKIWVRSRKGRLFAEDCSRRAFSFRLPANRAAGEGSSKLKNRAGSEAGSDLEAGTFSNGVCSRDDEAPSFARRTLLWIAGRKSKVVNHGGTESESS
ncbi:Putative RING-H2 finger protein ATL49 [Apostasia shenzhenica]|uniref:RING-type E3 ubiquitin transferase n=1 Tax=Apostasia shenzhenica TaxID=1088818 RepID=A0A2I0BGY1_9ASPA|nr:Putative RING-H2 finger protein ATL49 [Apostasia shenzhenica]